jgi:phage shock protein A
MDELLASGALNDLSTPVDDIQRELDKVSATSQVDNELAALKLELGSGGAGGSGAGSGADDGESAALPAADQSGNGSGSGGTQT